MIQTTSAAIRLGTALLKLLRWCISLISLTKVKKQGRVREVSDERLTSVEAAKGSKSNVSACLDNRAKPRFTYLRVTSPRVKSAMVYRLRHVGIDSI